MVVNNYPTLITQVYTNHYIPGLINQSLIESELLKLVTQNYARMK